MSFNFISLVCHSEGSLNSFRNLITNFKVSKCVNIFNTWLWGGRGGASGWRVAPLTTKKPKPSLVLRERIPLGFSPGTPLFVPLYRSNYSDEMNKAFSVGENRITRRKPCTFGRACRFNSLYERELIAFKDCASEAHAIPKQSHTIRAK